MAMYWFNIDTSGHDTYHYTNLTLTKSRRPITTEKHKSFFSQITTRIVSYINILSPLVSICIVSSDDCIVSCLIKTLCGQYPVDVPHLAEFLLEAREWPVCRHVVAGVGHADHRSDLLPIQVVIATEQLQHNTVLIRPNKLKIKCASGNNLKRIK